MASNSQKLLIEKLIDKIPAHYIISSLMICIVVILIEFFYDYIYYILNSLTRDLYKNFLILALSMLPYFYQLVAIKYLLNTTRHDFDKLDDIKCTYNDSCFQIKLMICNKTYLIAIFSIIIFIIYLDIWLRYDLGGFFPFYGANHNFHKNETYFYIIGDIWTNCFKIIYAFLIATSFWLFLNLYILLNKFKNNSLYSKISDFTAHIHEIAIIRGLILRYFLINIASIYSFFLLTFFWDIIYNVESNGPIQGAISSIKNISVKEYPVLALMAALFLTAILLLFVCLNTIRKFIKKLTNNEVALIEAKYYEQIQELVNFSPSENCDENAKRLNYMSNYVDILKKEQNRIWEADNLIPYIKFISINVGLILTTVVIPIVTIYVELKKTS